MLKPDSLQSPIDIVVGQRKIESVQDDKRRDRPQSFLRRNPAPYGMSLIVELKEFQPVLVVAVVVSVPVRLDETARNLEAYAEVASSP